MVAGFAQRGFGLEEIQGLVVARQEIVPAVELDRVTYISLIMLLLRLLFFGVVFAAVVVAAVPTFILVNLSNGGNGFGICEGGLGNCDFSFVASVELSTALMLVLIVLVALVRVGVHLSRRMRSEGGS
jgi:hypothetical protein